MPVIYLIGSLRNKKIPKIGNYLRSLGFEVFDDFFAASENADDRWKEYEKGRGHTYEEALKGYAARHVLNFDRTHLDRCDVGVLVSPAGRSCHLEIGYLVGKGKSGYILLNGESDRWDVMYGLTRGVYSNKESLGKALVENHLKGEK